MKIIIATPHRRHDRLVSALSARDGYVVHRCCSKEDLEPTAIDAIDPDYIFFPHWSWKIPSEIFDRHQSIIFHMTDLPYGRGGSPLQNLIRRGHTETKLSAVRCSAGFDEGPVYMKEQLSLLGTAEEIFLRAANLMEAMIVSIVDQRLQPVAQQGKPVIFRRLRPADGNLAETVNLGEAFDRIRMLDAAGYPPAFVDVGRFRIEFSRASLRLGSVMADATIRCIDEE